MQFEGTPTITLTLPLHILHQMIELQVARAAIRQHLLMPIIQVSNGTTTPDSNTNKKKARKSHFGGQRFGEMECWALQAQNQTFYVNIRPCDITGFVW